MSLPQPTPYRGGLSSFANLVQIARGSEPINTADDARRYLGRFLLLPGKKPRAGHPFAFPHAFPEDGPPDPLPPATAERIEAEFAALRAIAGRLATFGEEADDVPDDVCLSAAGEAEAAVGGVCRAIELGCWESGESWVQMLLLRRHLPPDQVEGCELVASERIFDRYLAEEADDFDPATMDEEDRYTDNHTTVSTLRLIYRLPEFESALDNAFPGSRVAWRQRAERIGRVHNALFPEEYCDVAFRDARAVTAYLSQPLGPTYAEEMARRQRIREQFAKESSERPAS